MAIKGQSHQFIVGYVFSKLEKHSIAAHMHRDKEIQIKTVLVPKVWFGLTADKRKENTISQEDIDYYRRELVELFNTYNSNKLSHVYALEIYPIDHFVGFYMSASQKELAKEMTIAEIEKELGYKIKVIGDKT